MFNQLKKTKTIAIKNFDEETYKLVKTIATLEGRTIASIFEEAVKNWLESRKDYEELMLWTKIEKLYEENFKVFIESGLAEEDREGYVLICDTRLIGVFKEYREALESSKDKCRQHTLIIKLPYKEKEEIELGLPW